MKKKFTLEIESPCSENFNKMVPNSNGSFCNSCAKNVIDLSKKTNSEIAKFIVENKDKSICARLKTTQLQDEFEYNELSKINNLKYAAIAASLLIASNVVAQEKTPIKTEVISPTLNNHIVGKIAVNRPVEKEIAILFKGKLLDSRADKPLSRKEYPNLVLMVNNSENSVKIDSKTGDFSVPMRILKSTKSIEITIMSGDYYLSKTISFDIDAVKGNVFQQNIIVNKEELAKVYIAGGLGINYTD